MPTGRARAAARPWTSSQVGAWLFLAALVAAGCNKTESCRTGTLFLNVGLGAYTNVDELDVDVSVADASDGGGPRHTVLTLKPGHSAGGVEVDFPDGYPTGKAVTVTLTLRSMGAEVAQRVSAIAALPPGCTAVSVDFAATDGGSGGVGGAAGAGGHGGATGSGGSAGTTGAAGQGGAAGGGNAGTTGAAGSGGQAGATGAGGGKAGAGGKAGTGGGAAGTSGGGAGGAACVPTGAEDCFNGKDDDCDGKIDCADPDCTPKAQCVTADPTAAPIGTLTGAGAGVVCPTGYGQTTAVMSGLNTLDCTAGGGCSCIAPAVTCSTTLVSYNMNNLCGNLGSVGQKAGTFTTGDDSGCKTIPPWSVNASGDIFGIMTTNFAPQLAGGCTPAGNPVVPTPSWSSKGTFCGTTMIGGGCGAGQVCVPVVGAASLCQLFDGAKSSCPGGASAIPWFTGVSGSASCGPCTCGAATGANCDNVVLTVGSDNACSGAASIASGRTQCFASGISEPGVQFSGTPVAPTCPAQSAYLGNLAPSGPKTLCCN
jgi:hypothetical protein